MSVLRTLAAGTLLTHEIEIKRSRFITTLARTDSPEEARELIDAVKSEHPQARHNCSAYLIDPPDAAPLQHSSGPNEPLQRDEHSHPHARRRSVSGARTLLLHNLT